MLFDTDNHLQLVSTYGKANKFANGIVHVSVIVTT